MSKKNRDKTICPICGVDHDEDEFEPDFDEYEPDVVTFASLTEEVIATWLRLKSATASANVSCNIPATLTLAWDIVRAANGY